jgi:hypothetical protein
MHEGVNNPNAPSVGDKCRDGNVFSWGLFQINLTVHDIGLGCTKAFTAKNYACTVKDRELFNRCVAKAKDPVFNIQYAAQLSQGGSNWTQWGANCVCHFPPWPRDAHKCR